jgi:hypothetical protein
MERLLFVAKSDLKPMIPDSVVETLLRCAYWQWLLGLNEVL